MQQVESSVTTGCFPTTEVQISQIPTALPYEQTVSHRQKRQGLGKYLQAEKERGLRPCNNIPSCCWEAHPHTLYIHTSCLHTRLPVSLSQRKVQKWWSKPRQQLLGCTVAVYSSNSLNSQSVRPRVTALFRMRSSHNSMHKKAGFWNVTRNGIQISIHQEFFQRSQEQIILSNWWQNKQNLIGLK